MNLKRMSIREICTEIKRPVEEFDIVELILNSAPPFEWCKSDYSHPIQQLGYYYFGIGDGFKFYEDRVRSADELMLWRLYGLIQTYWLVHYQEWYELQKQKNN